MLLYEHDIAQTGSCADIGLKSKQWNRPRMDALCPRPWACLEVFFQSLSLSLSLFLQAVFLSIMLMLARL
eukprot:1959711-Amphidinium_carterae.1